ncbi:MAG: DUF3298 and DUF4163 domain-containing protein [Saprospiraceae bacterium]|nr:DUF3298 and DUF4163 domain-containing protein [Saprospiraceae bacterium]
MKFNHYILLLLLSIIIVGIPSCTNDSPSDSNSESDNLEVIDSLLDNIPIIQLSFEGDTATYEQILRFKAESDEYTLDSIANKNFTHIILSYPLIDPASSPNASLINTKIKNLLILNSAGDLSYNSVEERMDDFITQYLEDKEFSAGLGWGVATIWYAEMNIQVLLNTPNLLSFRCTETSYMGGAHATEVSTYYNYNMELGERIKLENLFTPGSLETVEQIAEKHFRKAVKLDPQIRLADSDFEFEDGFFSLPKNFALERTGILFYYKVREINQPFPISFHLPYDEVGQYLNSSIIR